MLNTAQYNEMVMDALPVAKKYGLEQELEMAGFEVSAALIALEKVLNKIEESEQVVKAA